MLPQVLPSIERPCHATRHVRVPPLPRRSPATGPTRFTPALPIARPGAAMTEPAAPSPARVIAWLRVPCMDVQTSMTRTFTLAQEGRR